jgi:NAD(P)-dependent dehydrogenase (short-subunit alcohol dehydrogenase family)
MPQTQEMTASSETRELVVVTGASTGMGAATPRELARRGFHVLAGVRRDNDRMSLQAEGIEPVILDITDPDHVAALAARVERDPRPLRALVNNAGIPGAGPVEAMPLSQWRRIFEVNLFGATAAFLVRASRILPDRMLDRMTTSDLRKHFPAAADETT